MTKQEIFDKVAIHLLTQNAKSRAEKPFTEQNINSCRYRGSMGRMCAVGCLIPDDMYDVSIEDLGVDSPRLVKVLCGIGIYEHIEILKTLQNIHDLNPVPDWRNKLEMVAEIYALKSDCLDKEYDKARNI